MAHWERHSVHFVGAPWELKCIPLVLWLRRQILHVVKERGKGIKKKNAWHMKAGQSKTAQRSVWTKCLLGTTPTVAAYICSGGRGVRAVSGLKPIFFRKCSCTSASSVLCSFAWYKKKWTQKSHFRRKNAFSVFKYVCVEVEKYSERMAGREEKKIISVERPLFYSLDSRLFCTMLQGRIRNLFALLLLHRQLASPGT